MMTETTKPAVLFIRQGTVSNNVVARTYMNYMAKDLGRSGSRAFNDLLAKITYENPQLESLNLGENGLTDDFVDGIIKHLIANPKLPLEKLDLGGNLFTEDGVNCLLAAVEKRTDSPLTELFLRGNPGISDKMLERVEEVMAKNAKRIKGSMSGR